jgi:hypothetical protein
VGCFGITVGLVHFVDYHDGFQTELQGFLKDEPGLGHGTFKGVDEQQYAVGHVQDTLYFPAKVGVAGSVDDIDLDIFVPDGHVFRQNGDAAFAFNVVVVQNELPGLLVGTEQLAVMKNFVDQSGFAVVNVGDNRNVSDGSHTRGLLLGRAKVLRIIRKETELPEF